MKGMYRGLFGWKGRSSDGPPQARSDSLDPAASREDDTVGLGQERFLSTTIFSCAPPSPC